MGDEARASCNLKSFVPPPAVKHADWLEWARKQPREKSLPKLVTNQELKDLLKGISPVLLNDVYISNDDVAAKVDTAENDAIILFVNK